MNKKINKKIYIFVGIGLIILLLTLFGIKNFLNHDIIELDDYSEAINSYYKDMNTNETSMMALILNGYIDEKTKNECRIFTKKTDKIEVTKNCDKALEIAKKPVIIYEYDKAFKFGEWNKLGTSIKVTLKNNGNKYYNVNNIKNIIWHSDDYKIDYIGNDLKINDDYCDTSLNLTILFNDDTVIEDKFKIKIDSKAPEFINYVLKNGYLFSNYQDDALKNVYYYVGVDSNIPNKKDMVLNDDIKFECDKLNYMYSYAVDNAGNESEIKFLGTYYNECGF